MNPLSHSEVGDDLREVIAKWYFSENLTMREIKDRADLSLGVVHKIINNYRTYGMGKNPNSCRTGRPSTVVPEDSNFIRYYVRDHSTTYLDELQQALMDEHGAEYSISTLSRVLRSLRITHKHVEKAAAERNEELRCIWELEMGQPEFNNPDLYIFLDESAVDNHTVQRRTGWSEVNTPCVSRVTFLRGIRYSMLPALSADGIIALDIFEGSVTKELFLTFIREHIAPLLNPFPMKHSVVILDNCSIHHDAELRAIIEQDCGARLIFLPPYSPDLNPIEEAFSAIKSKIRRFEREYEGPFSIPWLIHQTLAEITEDDAIGWMTDCGYL